MNSRCIAVTMAFEATLEQGAYLCVLYNWQPEGADGVRLSTTEDYPPARFHVDGRGRFTDYERLDLPLLEPGTWHALRVRFSHSPLVALANDNYYPIETPAPKPGKRVGFRVGYGSVAVDNVRVYGREHTLLFQDDFNGLARFGQALGYVVTRVLPAALFLLLLARWRLSNWRRTFRMALVVGVTLAAAVFAYALLHTFYLAHLYPQARPLFPGAMEEEHFTAPRREAIEVARAEAANASGPGVLFLGASQTEGYGANTRAQGFVRVLERSLAAALPNEDVTVLNAGIGGANIERISRHFREVWEDSTPEVVVANIGFNDTLGGTPPEQFAAGVRQLAATAKARGAQVILVKEAASPHQFPKGVPLHRVLEEVGQAAGVPVLDANPYLRKMKNTGFLFWDCVHPTSYGHALIAEFLLPPLRETLHNVWSTSADTAHPPAQ
ncbi:MAG: SGNH/GDSL hydrolase family protein [Candidatus Hydrogenedentota bacterium]